MKLADISLEELFSSNYEKIKLDKDSPIDIYKLDGKKYIHFNPKFDDFKRDFDGFKNMPPPERPVFERFEEPIFFKLRPKPFDILLEDELNEENFKYFWLIVLVLIDILLLWFFQFTRKKLQPLISLKEDMINLSKGNFNISTKIDGKDEISQVIKEFNNRSEEHTSELQSQR